MSWIVRSSNEKRSPYSVPGSSSDVVPTGTFLWNLLTSFWTRIAPWRQLHLLEQQFQFYRDFSFTALPCSGIVRLGLLANSLLPQVINEYFLLRLGPQWGSWPCLHRCMLWHSKSTAMTMGRILDSSFLSFSAGEPMHWSLVLVSWEFGVHSLREALARVYYTRMNKRQHSICEMM